MRQKPRAMLDGFADDGALMKDVSVIIVNWNAAATLRACLRALFASEGDPPREVIVVDNASTDGSLSAIVAEYPDVHVIQNAVNVGFASAVNQGLRAAEGHFALIMNPDVMLHSRVSDARLAGAVRTLAAAFRSVAS